MTLTAAPRNTRASKVNLLYSIASKHLVEKGEVDLGILLDLLSYGHHYCRPELHQFLSENTHAFREDSVEESMAIYELTLNLLEQELGPLICDPDSDPDPDEEVDPSEVWGYAEVLVPRPTSSRGGALMYEEFADLWRHRAVALQAGHPDQRWYDGGLPIPSSTWRLAASGPTKRK